MTRQPPLATVAAMNDTPTSTQSLAGGALVAAAAFAVLAAIHLTHGTFDAQLTSFIDYANDAALSAALAGTAAGGLAVARLAGAPRWAAILAVCGPLLVLIGVAAGLALGHSPSWFAAVGVPGNLAWLAALVAVAISLWRTRAFPRPVAVLLPLTVIVGVGLAEFGGSILPALLWGYIALHIHNPTTTARRTGLTGPTPDSARAS